MCKHLEDLHNSVSQQSPNDKCGMLQNHIQVEDPKGKRNQWILMDQRTKSS